MYLDNQTCNWFVKAMGFLTDLLTGLKVCNYMIATYELNH